MAGRPISLPFKTVPVTNTPSTVAAAKSAADQLTLWKTLNIGFDATASTDGPAVVEICTWDLTSDGTPGSSPLCTNDNPLLTGTVQTQGYLAFTAEPTVLTPVDTFAIPTYGGSLVGYQLNNGNGLLIGGGKGIAVRVTTPSSVSCNADGALLGEE
jgi:hypothetical protein